MQRITILKGFSPIFSIQRRTLHDNVQKRFLATVKEVFPHKTDFPSRHIGPRKTEVVAMLDYIGYKVCWCFIIIYTDDYHFKKQLHFFFEKIKFLLFSSRWMN